MVVELLAKDKHEKLQYQGKCKLTIDTLSKMLLIEPSNENFKLISGLFKWKFVAQKNILFVFAEYDFQDFALVFDDSRKCKKIYGILLKKGACIGKSELVKNRFWPPLFAGFSVGTASTFKLKDIFVKWIEKLDEKEKEDYIQILKNYDILDLIFPNKNENNRTNFRKRKATDLQETYGTLKTIIHESSSFKIFHYKRAGAPISKLIVFCPTNKNLCYEYYFNKSRYKCRYCPAEKQVIASVCRDKNGMEYLKLNGEHICELREFDPENFNDDTIAKKSMYRFTSIKYNRNKSKTKYLILFTSEEKKFYYKFTFCTDKKHYYCRKCRHLNVRITVAVKNEGKENECVYVSCQKHICEPFEYTPLVDNNIVEAPNFQLVKRKTSERLVIFTNEEKNECHEYTWNKKQKYFLCYKCANKHKTYVYAKLLKNNENEEYVEICKNAHKCQPIKFIPEDITSRVVKMPDFKLWEDGKKKKLIIYDLSDRKMGYIYVYRPNTKNYVCNKCCIQKKKHVTAKLCQDDNGQNYLELNDAEHVCEPSEFTPVVEVPLTETQNFQLVKRIVNGNIIQRMAVFTNEEKNECYEYSWRKNNKYFLCQPCTKLHNLNVYAKVIKNDENEECVQLCKKPHKCQPLKFIPENISAKIVKQPNFKLWEDSSKKKRLTIYDNKNPKLGYIYVYRVAPRNYVCTKCYDQKIKDVTAKLCKDENGETFVELSDAEHICKMQKL